MANFKFPVPVAPAVGREIQNGIRTGVIRWTWNGGCFLWRQRLTITINTSGTASIGVTALDADTSSTLDLHTAFPNNLFPSNVDIQRGAYVRRITAFSGGTVNACTITVGDAGAANGLVTATDIFTGTSAGIVRTSGAAEYDVHGETAFIPVAVIATTAGNGSTLTAGDLEVVIPFLPHPT